MPIDAPCFLSTINSRRKNWENIKTGKSESLPLQEIFNEFNNKVFDCYFYRHKRRSNETSSRYSGSRMFHSSNESEAVSGEFKKGDARWRHQSSIIGKKRLPDWAGCIGHRPCDKITRPQGDPYARCLLICSSRYRSSCIFCKFLQVRVMAMRCPCLMMQTLTARFTYHTWMNLEMKLESMDTTSVIIATKCTSVSTEHLLYAPKFAMQIPQQFLSLENDF